MRIYLSGENFFEKKVLPRTPFQKALFMKTYIIIEQIKKLTS